MSRIVLVNDFDGNMINSMPLHGKLAGDVIYKHFGAPRNHVEDEYYRTSGPPFDQQLEIMFPGPNFSDRRKRCAQEYHERKIVEVYQSAQLFPEVADVLKSLSGKYPVLIATGTETPLVASLLDRNGILPYIDALWGFEYGSKAERLDRAKGLFASKFVVFTSDSESDVALSKKDGVITVGRTGPQKGALSKEKLKQSKASHVIESFEELPEILKTYEG